jgi:adenosylhomocysteine nucleosidase
MLLRYLVDSWLRQTAQEKLREAVTEFAKQSDDNADSETADPNTATTPEPVPCDVALIFALSVESGGIVDRLQNITRRRFRTRVEYDGFLDGRRVLAVDAGVGSDAAAHATQRVIKKHQPVWVVSTGFAGALQPDLRRGHVIMANHIVDESGQEFEVGLKMDPEVMARTRGLHVGRLLTVDRLVRTTDEKRRLGELRAALACDMETAAVAAECQQSRTRFLSVRVISDAVNDELPSEIEALLQQHTMAGKLGAAAGALFRRPSSVKDMWRMHEEATKASDRLAKFLEGVLPQLR